MGKLPLVSQLPKPVVIEGGKQQKPSNFGLGSILTQEEYGSAVIALVNEAQNESEDNGKIQGLSSALRRLLLSRCDPPLPLYWTLVAVEKSLWLDRTSKDPLEFGTSILNFAGRAFGSLKSLSAVNASGRTALSSIAPIVGLLYDVASLLSSTVGSLDEIQENNGNVGDNGKKARKLLRKLKEVVKNVLGFICLSHCKDLKAFERSFSLPPAPQIPLESFPDFLHPPLPLASKKSKALSSELSNSAVVADIVSGEVVILQLVVETLDRRILLKKRNTDFSVGQAEFVQRLKNLSVCSVWDPSSPSPPEMLLDVLLEKRLPVLDLLAAKEEVLLRGVLFEILLLDAPLFSLSDEESNSSLSAYSVLFMKKLSVARRAVAFFRSQQERCRLTSLLTQVADWQFPRQLLKWLKSQKMQRLPAIALQDQQTIINWLVNTAEKSVFAALLEESIATWSSGPTSVGTAEPVEVVDVENGDAPSDGEGEDLFFVDTAGETELANDSSAADLDFTAAAQAMRGESDKMKKKKKKQSQVLFHRHEQSSGGTKRARIEVDDVRITSSSGSDSEASVENRSKSAKKKSKHKAVDIPATSREGEVDDGGGALASAQLSGEEHSSPVKSGEFSKQQQTGHYSAQTEELSGLGSKEHAVGLGNKDLTDGGGAEKLLSQPGKEMVISPVPKSDVDVRKSVTTEVEPVLPTERKSARKKKKSKDPEDPGMEASADLCTPQRTEELAGGVGTEELTSVVGTEELPPQPNEEITITSVFANEMNIRDSLTTSQVDLVPPSVGKSAKKKKSKNSEDPAIEAPAELHPPKRSKEVAGGAGTEELNSAVGTEELPSRPGKEMAITSISANEVDARDSFTTSQVDLVPPSVGKSAKKKKSKNSEDPFMEAPADLHLPQRNVELAHGVGTEQLNSAVGTEELASQPDKEMVIASVSADGVDTRDSLTTSLSVGKSAKKKKKPKDLGDQNMEALAELYPLVRTEEVAGEVGTEELPSQPGEQMVITSVSANELGTRDSWTNSQRDLVPLSVGKSAKKKKKSKDPEDPVVEAPAELDPPHRTEERAGGVETEELTTAVGTKDLPSHPAEGMVIINSVPANEVDTRYCLTNSQVDIVTLSVGMSAKKKKSKDSGDAAMEAPVDVVDRSKDGSLLASTAETKPFDGDPEADTKGTGDALGNKNTELSKTMGDVETRADMQGEEVEDVVEKTATTSCEELEVRRSSSPLPILTPQTVGTDDLGGIGDITGVVQSPSLRDGQEEIPVVKSSRKKRTKEHRREGEEVHQLNFFDTIKEELVTASANFSSADLIDALQVEESLPADKQLSRKTKTPRSKRARLGEQGNNTGDIVGTVTIESANTVSALNSDKTRSSNETTDDWKVSKGDVAKTAEEALLSASLMQEILGNRQTEDADGRTHGESEENISVAVARQVNPPVDIIVSGGAATGPQDTGGPLGKSSKSPIKNVVEEVELGTEGTPSKQNSDGTGTSGSRRRRLKSKTDVGLATVAEERVQPKEEVFEEAPTPSPPKMVEGGQVQGELEVRTPDAEVHSSDVEVVTSVKPSSRKRKTKPEIFQLSGGSDTTDELLYQRRTRSGRALGTPPPTPTRSRRANMRRKLLLEPLEEEK
ncbi:unnamed protein product [Calypogeia fissa]